MQIPLGCQDVHKTPINLFPAQENVTDAFSQPINVRVFRTVENPRVTLLYPGKERRGEGNFLSLLPGHHLEVLSTPFRI